MKNITKSDLSHIVQHALRAYVDDDMGDLDNKEFVAQCYFKAVIMFLSITEEFEFPVRKDSTSIDDING